MSKVVYTEMKLLGRAQCLHCHSCRMCWQSRCSPVAKPLRNDHIPLTSFAQATVLVPHAWVCHRVEMIQSENNFLEQSCCQGQDKRQPQGRQSHSTARQAWLSIHCISFSGVDVLSPCLLLTVSSLHPAHCIGTQRKCCPVGLTCV